jgi:hypothetical protein
MSRYSKVMFILAGVLIAWGMSISYSADWQMTTVENDDDGYGFGNVHIKLDSADHPCITYDDEWWDGDVEWYDYLIYAHWTGYNWDIASIDYLYGFYNDTSLALDSRDYPLIACACEYYTENKYYDPLVLVTWTGSDWDIQSVCDELEPSNNSTALVVDSLDYPQIVFSCWEDSASPGLIYAKWNGSKWDAQVVDAYLVWGDLNIALDSQDNPHIAYVNNQMDELEYAELLEGSWSIQILDSYSYYPISLALDSQGFPHIAYGYGSVKYCYWDGASWVFETVDNGRTPCLTLDSQDNPHLSYIDSSTYALEYAHKTGDSWEITNFDNAHSDENAVSLALDTQDHPHICFYDYVLNKLRYLWYGEPFDVISLQSFTANYAGKEIVVNWSVSDNTLTDNITGFNLYRREIEVAESAPCFCKANTFPPQNNEVGWTKINPTLITGDNPYSYSDSSVQLSKSYEYKLEAVLTDQSSQTLGTTSCATKPPSFAITALYPNPANDLLNLTLSTVQAGVVTLALYDLSGRLVESQTVPADSAGEMKVKMDVSLLSEGIYILRATQEGVEAMAKMVIAR